MNDVLDFGGHFLSLGWDSFFKRGGFSTATPIYNNHPFCKLPVGATRNPKGAKGLSTGSWVESAQLASRAIVNRCLDG